MSYEKIRNKKVSKYLLGGVLNGSFEERMKKKLLRQQLMQALGIAPEDAGLFTDEELSNYYLNTFGPNPNNKKINFDPNAVHGVLELPNSLDPGKMVSDTSNIKLNSDGTIRGGFVENLKTGKAYEIGLIIPDLKQDEPKPENDNKQNALNITNSVFESIGFNAVNTTELKTGKDDNKTGLSEGGLMALGITSQGLSKAMNATDEVLMGDKNFSTGSQAIDAGVHGLSSMAMKSGNPYLMVAGAALEGLNFITKAGGRTVPGYDVDIQSSGYGNLGHMESSSGRIWDKWTGKTGRLLAKRNEQARMALSAADISQDQSYQQEARINSVTNVLQANLIALAGGIDTSLLGN